MPPELETVDIDGVEILSAGGPYHGHGSPKGGDYFSAEFLAELAAANATLTDLKPPIKIGHNAVQKLLHDSGLSADEMPAAGHLAAIRVGERDGVAKLLADLKKVPKKLASLINSGAFRTRSVEMGRVYAQGGDNQGTKLTAITALALLGAKAPAVRTLDDIIALYSEEGVSDDFGDDMTEVVVSDTRPVVEGEIEMTFSEGPLADTETAWIVPYRVWGDEEIELSERALWREKEKTVMPTTKPADTQGMKIKDLSDEQLRTLGDTLGIGDEIEGDALRDAVADTMTGLVAEEDDQTKPKTPDPVPAPGTVVLSEAEVAEYKANSLLVKSLAEERKEEKREAVVMVGGVEKGKIAPADADTWKALYDANPEATTKAIADLPVNDSLARAFGADGEGEGGGDGGGGNEQEEAEYREFASILGLPAEEE